MPARRSTLNHYLLIVFDSCRYDSFRAARPRHLRKLGQIERRWSYASWTAPSHYNLLTGLMPHQSPKRVYASEYYKAEFPKFDQRLGANGVEFQSLAPDLYLPAFLQRHLGYRTHALVSMPVLNPHTILNSGFDRYRLMPKHNDFGAILDALEFSEQPSFHLLNTGETHYPYALADEPEGAWPRLSGVHGVFQSLGKRSSTGKRQRWFSAAQLADLRERQILAVKFLDSAMERLFDIVPRNTYITVTSDHGELFGEDGYFGHGPIQHPKVLEVPFVEGKIR
ncbi:MAG TPA: sulfatase-like hydrolase/transferase [Verrucomicrobiae bacterium]|nr:sulfatase-like hydrolase/transferase [Verrucomicrobiae bacterium]